jgi:hypothetical protein
MYKTNTPPTPFPKADTKLYDIITVDLMLSFIDDINGQQGRSSIFIYHDMGREVIKILPMSIRMSHFDFHSII